MAEDWVDDAKQRYDELRAGKTFKLAEGDNCFRILPRRRPDRKFGGQPWFEFMQHREVGPKDRQRYPTCGKDIKGNGDCWLCDVIIPKLMQSGERAKKARAAALQPVPKFVVQISVVDAKGRFGQPTLWNVSHGKPRSLSVQVMAKCMPGGKKDYVNPMKGYNLNINRTGTGKFDTKYGALEGDVDPTQVPKSILMATKPFEELVEPYSEEKQKAAYFGRDIEEEEETVSEEQEAEGTEGTDEEYSDQPEDEAAGEEGGDVEEDNTENYGEYGDDNADAAEGDGEVEFEEVTGDDEQMSEEEELEVLFGGKPKGTQAKKPAAPANKKPAPKPAQKPAPKPATRPGPTKKPAPKPFGKPKGRR